MQYEFNSSLLDVVVGVVDNISRGNLSAANSELERVKSLIAKRNKLVRFVDKSPAGWTAVEEYESDELADDSEDEKKLRSARQDQGEESPFVGVSPSRKISALAADREATERILQFVQAALEDPSQPSQTVKMQADKSYQAVFQRLGQDEYDLR